MFSALGGPAAAEATTHSLLCSAIDRHPRYLLLHPAKLIINGVIDSPSFDPLSSEIVKRHVNAFVLADHLDTKDNLRDFLKYSEANLDEIITRVELYSGVIPV